MSDMKNKKRLEVLLAGGVPDVPPTWELVFQIQETFFGMPARKAVRVRDYASEEARRDALWQYDFEVYERCVEELGWAAIPGGYTPEEVSFRKKRIGDRALVVGYEGSGVFWMPSGEKMVDFAVQIYEQPESTHAEARQKCDAAKELFRRLVDAGADLLVGTWDFGFNTQPFVSPEKFEEIVVPYMTELVDCAHSLGRKLILHSDGCLTEILDLIHGTGIDGYQSVDPQGGMDIKTVREKFPDWLLMGNVACNMLQDTNDTEIRKSVRYCMEHGGIGKPYIFSTSNCIFNGMPTESYKIMLDEYQRLIATKMKTTTYDISARATGAVTGVASERLLSNNIEAYENTVPSMLSDRLRNPKFSGPEDPQTGIAAQWEPDLRCMGRSICRLVPGMYLSGREAQLIHNFGERASQTICQHGVQVRCGEEFEVEMWARAHNRPISVTVGLRLAGMKCGEDSSAKMEIDQAYWVKRTCRIKAPGQGGSAFFFITVPGDSRLVVDQVHLRPVGESHVSRAFLDVFEQLPCPVLRFPGGCESCTYHWEHGTGPVHLRPVCDDPVFKYKVHYDFGTDEYLELCVNRGITPCITLNTTTDTPESAAAWAAYVRQYYVSRTLEIPAAYFMIGNENSGTHELGHMTGAMYLDQLRAFVPAVRKAYPEAKMLAIGEQESRGLRLDQTTVWRDLLIEQGSDLFDMLVVTRYSVDAASSFETSVGCIGESVRKMEDDMRQQAAAIRKAGLDCTMGIVEWNYWTQAGHNDHAGFYEPNDIRHCLYVAGMLNAYCRMGEILEMANYYSLVNTMGLVQIRDGQLVVSDVAKVFNLFAPALPGEVLELDMDGEAARNGMVDASFLRRGNTLYGFLINFSPSETARISLQQVGDITEAQGLTAKAILAPVDHFSPDFENNTILVPPASLVRVVGRP